MALVFAPTCWAVLPPVIISFGSRLGEDIRELGSGSVGARNVGRILGKTGFLVTLICDFGKGALAVWAAHHFTKDERIVAFAMVAVVAGHIWPAQLVFTAAREWRLRWARCWCSIRSWRWFIACCSWARLCCYGARCLPGLFALICLPLVALFLGQDRIEVVLMTVTRGLVLFAHRKNIADEISLLIERRHMHAESDKSL